MIPEGWRLNDSSLEAIPTELSGQNGERSDRLRIGEMISSERLGKFSEEKNKKLRGERNEKVPVGRSEKLNGRSCVVRSVERSDEKSEMLSDEKNEKMSDGKSERLSDKRNELPTPSVSFPARTR